MLLLQQKKIVRSKNVGRDREILNMIKHDFSDLYRLFLLT